jgi:SAM-dependent MidA family methyltransferase
LTSLSQMTSLPQPSAEQLAHSAQVAETIRAEIAAAGGWITFSRYMEMALYAPGLGYYSAGMQKFGAGGDFVTAPEISSLFGRTLARQAAQILRTSAGDMLELGAGTGRLAVQLLTELETLEALPQRYLILEVSAHLRAVQQETIARELSAALAERVQWLEHLPADFSGCIIANEVLDALPVHVVSSRQDGFYERGIGIEEDSFGWQERKLETGGLHDTVRELELPANYVTEVCLALPALVASLAEVLQQGAMLLIDYGFPRREYYHPQRDGGTLMCHYRHLAHDNPLLFPGLQDITAHVDFTVVATAGVKHGLQVLGYTSQAQFLINNGITDLLSRISPSNAAQYLPLAAEAQKLLSPAEMGELFKVIALGKGLEQPLLGFSRGDKRHAL